MSKTKHLWRVVVNSKYEYQVKHPDGANYPNHVAEMGAELHFYHGREPDITKWPVVAEVFSWSSKAGMGKYQITIEVEPHFRSERYNKNTRKAADGK